jgi:DNA-binding GntR family transcriptional regulator
MPRRPLRQEEIERLEQALTYPPPTSAAMTLQFDEHNHDFHRTIILANHSPRRFTTFEAVYNDVRRLQYAGIGKPRPDLIHHEHVEILRALARSDGAAARELMSHHIDAMRQRAFQAWADGPEPGG